MKTKNEKTSIGRIGTISLGCLDIAVVITDERTVFGRRELQVEPANGHGRKWITEKKVDIKR